MMTRDEKGYTLRVYLSDAEIKLLKHRAVEAEQSLSAYVTEVLRREAEKAED